LPNRLLFNSKLEDTLQRSKRHNKKFALLFLDLDRFRAINDVLGHKNGDLLLQVIADRLKNTVRQEDTVARHGGDEFIILLNEVSDAKDAAILAEKVAQAISRPIKLAGSEIVTSTSIGISVYPGDANDIRGLIKAADAAMYRAKAEGKNTCRFYTAELTAKAAEHLAIEHGLRRALEKNEFILNFQPLISLKDKHIVGVEALLRWRHPQRGLLHPDSFIHVAEETGIICDIGNWVLRETCRQVKKWRRLGLPPIRVAINVSARQVLQDDLEEKVIDAYRAAGIGRDDFELEMEITESVLQRAEENFDTLIAVRKMGVRLSIDDFGTGYSSLSKLKHFPFDTIKIDRSFIHDIPGDKQSEAVVSAIITLAHAMKLNVVAEGVESQIQNDFLQHQGCDTVQGNFYNLPVSANKVREMIAL
jgi:diguanylate cyclase (GGDEF)-like protein